MKPIFLVKELTEYFAGEPCRVNTRLDFGYFENEAEAEAFAESQQKEEFQQWIDREYKTYHYYRENQLYPELIENDTLAQLSRDREFVDPGEPLLDWENWTKSSDYVVYVPMAVQPRL